MPEQAARLRGSTASEVRAGAKSMRRGLGLGDLEERDRDEQGRFRAKSGQGVDMNAVIRHAARR